MAGLSVMVADNVPEFWALLWTRGVELPLRRGLWKRV